MCKFPCRPIMGHYLLDTRGYLTETASKGVEKCDGGMHLPVEFASAARPAVRVITAMRKQNTGGKPKSRIVFAPGQMQRRKQRFSIGSL